MQALDKANKLWKSSKNVVMNVPEIKVKVRDATSNEKWGPSGTQMREIASATHSYEHFPLIMETIWGRLSSPAKNWRHVYKSLLLLDYLIKNGAQQVVRECRVKIVEIQTLMDFHHIDEKGKDVGISGWCFLPFFFFFFCRAHVCVCCVRLLSIYLYLYLFLRLDV
jgi:epsin